VYDYKSLKKNEKTGDPALENEKDRTKITEGISRL
jgi:hypothetical protein